VSELRERARACRESARVERQKEHTRARHGNSISRVIPYNTASNTSSKAVKQE
jgi:hypothetical protein